MIEDKANEQPRIQSDVVSLAADLQNSDGKRDNPNKVQNMMIKSALS